MGTLDYYNSHSEEFYEYTKDISMEEHWNVFTDLLPDNGSILDLGCGSGRDSVYFMSRGFDVTALDGSENMCNLASIHIGQEVLHMEFQDIDFDQVFDGVWANASLHHVPSNEIDEILEKVVKSLKINGIMYMSFHYGEEEGLQDERYYTDYRTRTLKELISRFEKLELIDIRKSQDIIPGRDVQWIYALVRKI
ncbi:MAG TPA: class I SAM-dependent methyltransferase [Clostridiales bacterium]|nr:class I SAM-dependent methyltransferase [Clostridiales bacterium]